MREADIGQGCTCPSLPEDERPCPAHRSIIRILEDERARCLLWAEQYDTPEAQNIALGIRSGDPVT